MFQDGVFMAVEASKVMATGNNLLSTWTMKKKPYRTYRERLVARAFQQVEGQHHDDSAILSLLTSNTAI